jgi:hypothetical protein
MSLMTIVKFNSLIPYVLIRDTAGIMRREARNDQGRDDGPVRSKVHAGSKTD